MKYEYERRQLNDLGFGHNKKAVSLSTTDPLMERLEPIVAATGLSRSELIEIAILRFADSYQKKLTHDRNKSAMEGMDKPL